MRFFTCILDPLDHGIPETVLRDYEALARRRGLQFHWQSSEQMAVLTASDDPYRESLVALGQPGGWAAVGNVRLDNRRDLEGWAQHSGTGASDLEMIRRVIAEHGTRYVREFLGDFAFVVWRASTRSGVAACDAFAVRQLFYTERNDLLVFSSRAEALARGDEYEPRYLAELVAQWRRTPDVSVYAGVRPIPRASLAILQPNRPVTIRRYWRASDYAVETSWADAADEAVATCRRLLIDSVRLRMSHEGETWAQLSGGIDSSSVVSCAQWLAARGESTGGLAGTVTFVDHHGTGTDEREYSEAVTDRWKVRNVAIVDPPTWYDGAYDVPHLDQPNGDILVYPRDRRLCATIRAAGGRVLFTGYGGDQLFTGTMLFFADWIVRGHISYAIREMARRAAIGRVSFWQLAYRNALLPLMPHAAHIQLVRDQDEVPTIPWLDKSTMKRFGLATRPAVSATAYGGRLGHKYHHAVVSMVDRVVDHYQGGVIADSLDVQHPMLYRPLVEFALRLPQELRARPQTHRWVLRQAMQGILPEKVRMRVGKPGTSDFLGWSLTTERDRLSALTRSPILGDLGVVEPIKLRAAFESTSRRAHGSRRLYGSLLSTLAVEMWLRIRSGRWPCV